MIVLTNTDTITASSSKTAKAKLWRLPFKRLNKPLIPSALIKALSNTHTVFASTLPPRQNMMKCLSANRDTDDYYAIADMKPESPFKVLDIEPRTNDILHWAIALTLPKQQQEAYIAEAYPYLNITPRELLDKNTPMLSVEQIHSRTSALTQSYVWQYSDSHGKLMPNTDIEENRLHVFLCFDKTITNTQAGDYIALQFPEEVIPNDDHILKQYALDRVNSPSPKPLHIDLVTYRPKQKMFMSPNPLHLVGDDSLLSSSAMANRLNIHSRYNTTAPTPINLVRADLVEAYKVAEVNKHGSLSRARAYYDLHGNDILTTTLLYDTSFKLLGTAEEVINNADHKGKNCNYGIGNYYNPTASGYLQVGAEGGYLTDHRTKQHINIVEPTVEVVMDSQYIPIGVKLQHSRQAIIAMTGAGKTHSFKNRPYTVLLVPQTKQVLSQKTGYIRVVAKDTHSVLVDNKTLFDDFGTAIRAGHTTFICTYDRLAGSYATDKALYQDYTIIADEIHEFLTIEATNKYGRTRDILYQAFRNKEEFKAVVFMSATISASILRDIISGMPITTYITTQPETKVEVVFSLPYEANRLYESSPQYLRDIIRRNGKTVIYINNKSVGRGIIAEYPLGADTITGTSGNDPVTVLESEPELLLITSALKQGFSIEYPVDTYVIYLDYRGGDDYSMNEIEQITARCRDVKNIVIVASPRRLAPLSLMALPSQEQALEIAMDFADGKTNNEWEAEMLKGYYPLLKGINTQGEDEGMPLFYISERKLLGNRMQLDSRPKAYGLKYKKTVTINKRQATVTLPANLARVIPNHSMPKKMTDLKKALRFDVDTWADLENILLEYAPPDDILAEWDLSVEEQETYNTLLESYSLMIEERNSGRMQSMLCLMLCLPMYEGLYNGWRHKDDILEKITILLGKNKREAKAVSTIQRMWKGNEKLAKSLGVKRHNDLTAIRTLDILRDKLHQVIEYVAENKDNIMETLEEVIYDGTQDLKELNYDSKYPDPKQGTTVIGYTTTDGKIFRVKREKRGNRWAKGYPVGSKVIITNKGYIYAN